MIGLPLMFMAPLVLVGLLALPAIWLLLRITPPSPKRIAFPPLRIFRDLAARNETPAHTPWWILLMRLAICASVIIASAGPLWNASPAEKGTGPLLVLIDNGFTAARDWRERHDFALEKMQETVRSNRPVAFLAFADAPLAIALETPDRIFARLNGLKPAPYLPNRSAHLPTIQPFLNEHPDAGILWISDGVSGAEGSNFAERLAEMTRGRAVNVVRKEKPQALGLTMASGSNLGVRVLRAIPNGRDRGMVHVLDAKGQPVAEAPFQFEPSATETELAFDIPTELRNNATRIDIAGENSAGAVALVDERNKRRTVGIVSGGTIDQSQPLLSPTYYVARALQPFADIRYGRGGISDAIAELLDQKTGVLVLADVGTLDEKTHDAVARYVENGGLLIRFAGTRLAAGRDDLVPVRLRQGDRNLGSALSWSEPKKLAPFSQDSPFYGLTVPQEVTVRRQILAEPDSNLANRTWASLEDGTPLVTAERRGNGMIILFHVTATPTWSNLPLSGLLVDMLRRSIAYGQSSTTSSDKIGLPLAPRIVLDGYGVFSVPPATSRAVPAGYAERANRLSPPGFYGQAGASITVNALTPDDRLTPNNDEVFAGSTSGFAKAASIDLRMPFYIAALVLLLLDTSLVLWLGGMRFRNRHIGRAAMFLVAFGLSAVMGIPSAGQTLSTPNNNRLSEVQKSALVTRLAYVITGDPDIDATSKAGLRGLGQALSLRTAFEPGDPVGVDPERDELAFFPLLYWPVAPAQMMPSSAAVARLDAFMKNGGTILFDTRDALTARSDASTPEASSLRRLLLKLDVPQMETLPSDHVLSKTFYLLDQFPGRYNTSLLWVESSNRLNDDEESGPIHSGDGVSPIIVTGNDFAAAWAIGPRNETLYPMSGSDPNQREMAFRVGINIVLYTLTGNYKADQVHVPDLLRRLERQGER